MSETDLLTVEEVAAELRVHHSTVRRWIAGGALRAHRPGPRSMRVSRPDLARFLAESAARSGQAHRTGERVA